MTSFGYFQRQKWQSILHEILVTQPTISEYQRQMTRVINKLELVGGTLDYNLASCDSTSRSRVFEIKTASLLSAVDAQ